MWFMVVNVLLGSVIRPLVFFFFQAEDGIRDLYVTGVQTCALPIYSGSASDGSARDVHADRSQRSLRHDVVSRQGSRLDCFTPPPFIALFVVVPLGELCSRNG